MHSTDPVSQAQRIWTAFVCRGRSRCGPNWNSSAAGWTLRPNASSTRLRSAVGWGDPCWEGVAARGLGRVAIARGDTQRAVEILLDAIGRCVRLPDAYLWGKAYAELGWSALDWPSRKAHARRRGRGSKNELLTLTARTGMRELTARAHLHRAGLGERSSATAARLLGRGDRQSAAGCGAGGELTRCVGRDPSGRLAAADGAGKVGNSQPGAA